MLQTPRLLLRPPAPEDFDAFLSLRQDPVAMRFMGGVRDRDAAWRQFGHIRMSWMLGGISQFSVVNRDDGAWIGLVGPWRLLPRMNEEFRWEIATPHQRRGYGTEAAGCVLDWLFREGGRHEALFHIEPGNAASFALAARLGATHMGSGSAPAPFASHSCEIFRLPAFARQPLVVGG